MQKKLSQMGQPTTNLISVAEYAEQCNVTKVTVYKRIRNGEVPFLQLGKLIFIDASKVAALGQKKRGRKTAMEHLSKINSLDNQ